ncbi:MAG: lipid-A-disaccharide synthase [Terrimicrobiaceae bacterium]
MSDLFFWFVAGEESGDARAFEVMTAIRDLRPSVRFGGAGGARMQSLCTGPFDNWIGRAAVVGLWDVLKNYGYFRAKFESGLRSILAEKPDAVVLVDYPGFNLRLAKALRSRGYSGKILYYISPQVWAWNRSRIPRMARILDLMICVFPFEAPMYEASGLHTIFAGHPLLEALAEEKGGEVREENLLGLFPGSREREVKRNFPAMLGAARIVAEKLPAMRFEAAAAGPARAEMMRRMAEGFPVMVVEGRAHSLMQRATAGLVCSGTATLEAAFFGLPYALVYKTAWLTFEVGKRVVDVNALGIVNILNNYLVNPPPDPRLPASAAPHVVREFIQDAATPAALATEALRLLGDAAAREDLAGRLEGIVATLRADGAGRRAAKALLDAAIGSQAS